MRSRIVRLSLFGTTALLLSACGLVLGLPGSDEVKNDYQTDGAVDGFVPPDVAVPDTGGDTVVPPADGGDASCSADLTKDPLNCGRCGRSCYGEACTSGKCAPHLIGSGGKPENLRVANGYVYWSDLQGGVVKRVKTDGTGTQTIATASNGVSGPWGFTIDAAGTTIYIASTSSGKVFKCPVTGCPSTATSVDPVGSKPAYVELAGNGKLYYLDVYDNKVYENSTSGGARVARATTDTSYNSGLLAGFTIDATHAYWTEPYNGIDLVKRVPLAGGAVESIVASNGPRYPTSPRKDGTKLWFVARGLNDNAGSINDKNADGTGNLDPFATGLNNPLSVYLDAENVYWVDEGSVAASGNGLTTDGRVLRCPRSGCGVPEELAKNQMNPVALDGDTTDVFWAEFNGGKIYRLAK